MLFYDEIDQFMESAIYDMSVESDLGIYNDDVFEEGVFDKVKGFFQLGTQRSRELDENLRHLSAIYSSDGIPSDKSWSIILKVLQVLLKISAIGNLVNISIRTFCGVLAALAETSVGGAITLSGLVGSLGVAIPVFILLSAVVVVVYKLFNKLINEGLEDDAVRRSATVLNFLKGIRNNVAKRSPAQAKHIDNEIAKLATLLETHYTESYTLEDTELYSGSRAMGLQLSFSQDFIKLIRHTLNGAKLIESMDNSQNISSRLMAVVDKHIKDTYALLVPILGSLAGYVGGVIGAAILEETACVVASIMVACAAISMIVMLVTLIVAIINSIKATTEIKNIGFEAVDKLNALSMKTKNPALKESILEYKRLIIGAIDNAEKDPETHIVYSIGK